MLALAAGVSLSFLLRRLLPDGAPRPADGAPRPGDELERGIGLLVMVGGLTQLVALAGTLASFAEAARFAQRAQDGLIAMFCAALTLLMVPAAARSALQPHERLAAGGSALVALACLVLGVVDAEAWVPYAASRSSVALLLMLTSALALQTVQRGDRLPAAERAVLVRVLLTLGLTATLELLLIVALGSPSPIVPVSLAVLAPAADAITRCRLVQQERVLRSQQERTCGLEAQLERVVAEAEHAKSSRARFVANVSHELRTPVHGIIGLASLLGDTRLDPRQREMLSHLTQCGKALRGLVDDVIDFSRIDAGKTQLRPDWVDLRSTVGDVLATLAHSAHDKGLGLESRFLADVPTHVHTDPLRFRQILLNLCSNAVKFTTTGDVRVTVRVRRADAERAWLECEVQDTGMGIPAEKLPHLFDPFFQGDASDTREFGGSGLGLAISRDLVLTMGGELGVDSAVDQGSRFHFRLPVQLREEPDAWRLPINPGTRVLVLDWDGLLRFAVEPMLEASRAQITWRRSAAEVRPNEHFDVILDGALALHQRVAELRAASGARWIACIALDDRVEWPRGANPNAIVYRPLVASRLADVLREAPLQDAPAPVREQAERLDVLVVDDNPVNLLVACRLVEALGHASTPARDGAEALQMLEQNPSQRGPDIILMDCQMPGIDGFEATRRIRARFGGQHRILAVTAATFEEDRLRAMEAGMDGFIHKPVDMDQLREAMHRTMYDREDRWARNT